MFFSKFLSLNFLKGKVFASDSSTDDQYIHLISLHCLLFVMCALKLTSTVKCKLHWLHLFESLLRALHLARQETQPTPTSSRGVLLYVLMPCASIIHFYRKFHNCASSTCPAAETETRLPTLPPAPEVSSPSSLLSLLLAEVDKQGGRIIALVALGQEERRNGCPRPLQRSPLPPLSSPGGS